MLVNPWGLTPGAWKDNIPLGYDAERFIMENCEYVIYLRKHEMFKCVDHWKAQSENPVVFDKYCPVCKGFGLKTDIEIIPSRISIGGVRITPNRSVSLDELGYVEYNTAIGHFPRAVTPAAGDYVLQCEWNRATPLLGTQPPARPLKVVQVHTIKSVATRFEREVSWISCGLEREDILIDQMSLIIANIKDVKSLDVEGTWRQYTYW